MTAARHPILGGALEMYGCLVSVSIVVNLLLSLALVQKQQEFRSSDSQPAFIHTPACSNHGILLQEGDDYTSSKVCSCHACFYGEYCSQRDPHCLINVDHGDPTMFEALWQDQRWQWEATSMVILGWQRMSYFPKGGKSGAVCWFLEPKLERAIRGLHHAVGNAIVDDTLHIVVGTGSTQLFQAALYALSSSHHEHFPVNVVSAAPYYSSYQTITDFLESRIYRWAGDALQVTEETINEREGDYLELVTSPNNPDGTIREAVLEGLVPKHMLIHDLAYYWPQFTPITSPANHDLMLFTVSKSTGHAGTRIGWALVKDEKIARLMTKFIELNTIGVSQDSQLRAAQILRAVTTDCDAYNECEKSLDKKKTTMKKKKIIIKGKQMNNAHSSFFHKSYVAMEQRWEKLQSAVESVGDRFSLPEFQPSHCNFFKKTTSPKPAFAWLRCHHVSDCAGYLQGIGIIARGGQHFGTTPDYVRMSMLDRDDAFDLLIERLRNITQ